MSIHDIHSEPHPLAGKTVQVDLDGNGPADFVIEDWWDRVFGGSWMDAGLNPAAIGYSIRTGFAIARGSTIPIDDEVVYGKRDGFGHIVHVTEFAGATA